MNINWSTGIHGYEEDGNVRLTGQGVANGFCPNCGDPTHGTEVDGLHWKICPKCFYSDARAYKARQHQVSENFVLEDGKPTNR